eukprot:CAMPEP_0169370472 /NCGR_PEP_ID=MMETSP1017-20121227/35373_1 /TAXON_ID=342587 /ORGANISM="Karlodinium micrum, Strain CCMP2283" /LENGTH=40 /DNA_ID= /DNA_START= /DNA_END= /DNA_ORIENTATION=
MSRVAVLSLWLVSVDAVLQEDAAVDSLASLLLAAGASTPA